MSESQTTNEVVIEAAERDMRMYGVGGYEKIKSPDGTVTLGKLTLEEARKLQEQSDA